MQTQEGPAVAARAFPRPGTPRRDVARLLPASRPVPTPAATCPCRQPPVLVSPASAQPPPAPSLDVLGEGLDHQGRAQSLARIGAWGRGCVPVPLDPGNLRGLSHALPVHGSSRRARIHSARKGEAGSGGSSASARRGALGRRWRGPGWGAGAGPRVARVCTRALAQPAVTVAGAAAGTAAQVWAQLSPTLSSHRPNGQAQLSLPGTHHLVRTSTVNWSESGFLWRAMRRGRETESAKASQSRAPRSGTPAPRPE